MKRNRDGWEVASSSSSHSASTSSVSAPSSSSSPSTLDPLFPPPVCVLWLCDTLASDPSACELLSSLQQLIPSAQQPALSYTGASAHSPSSSSAFEPHRTLIVVSTLTDSAPSTAFSTFPSFSIPRCVLCPSLAKRFMKQAVD